MPVKEAAPCACVCVSMCTCVWHLSLEGSEGSGGPPGALGSPATPLWATPLCMYHGGGCAGRSGKGFRASPGLLALGIRGALWWHLQTQTPSL